MYMYIGTAVYPLLCPCMINDNLPLGSSICCLACKIDGRMDFGTCAGPAKIRTVISRRFKQTNLAVGVLSRKALLHLETWCLQPNLQETWHKKDQKGEKKFQKRIRKVIKIISFGKYVYYIHIH